MPIILEGFGQQVFPEHATFPEGRSCTKSNSAACNAATRVVKLPFVTPAEHIFNDGIHVEKQLEPVSNVLLDRQKLLQILTNLISNTKQAFQSDVGNRS